jgi:hypothetical protein
MMDGKHEKLSLPSCCAPPSASIIVLHFQQQQKDSLKPTSGGVQLAKNQKVVQSNCSMLCAGDMETMHTSPRTQQQHNWKE